MVATGNGRAAAGSLQRTTSQRKGEGSKASDVSAPEDALVAKRTSRLPASLALSPLYFAVGSTLLPEHIAEMVTNLSIVARVSLRATAYFLEIILEASKSGTSLGFGITRRALISAIGAARTMHALTAGDEDDWSSDALQLQKFKGSSASNPIISLLDKYTAVGISVIHHTMTMAELMANAGISLVQEGIRAGAEAAEESVKVLEGVFGSNETSRALSGFIELLKREFDSAKLPNTGGGIRSMAALTRAVTTFAVVQAACHRRTARTHNLRVLYDCTVLGTDETASWRSVIMGHGSFAPASVIPSSPSDRRSLRIEDGRRGSRLIQGDAPCLTDIPQEEAAATTRESDSNVFDDLDYFCRDEATDVDALRSPSSKIRLSQISKDHQLPAALRKRLSLQTDEALAEGVELDEETTHSEHPRRVRHTIRKQKGETGSDTLWEITTETTEITETIREEVVSLVDGSPPSLQASPSAGSTSGSVKQRRKLRLPKLRRASAATSNSDGSPTRQRPQTIQELTREISSSESIEERRSADLRGEEQTERSRVSQDEWVEISRTLSHYDFGGAGSSSNGQKPISPSKLSRALVPTKVSSGTSSTAVETASGSRERVRVVLKTVQKKLKKTTRIITRRDAEVDDDEGETEEEMSQTTTAVHDPAGQDTSDPDSTPVERDFFGSSNGKAYKVEPPRTPPQQRWSLARSASKAKSGAETPANPVTPATGLKSAFSRARLSSPAASPSWKGGAAQTDQNLAKTPHRGIHQDNTAMTPFMTSAIKRRRSGRRGSQASVRSVVSHHQFQQTSNTTYGTDNDRPAYPHDTLANNLQHFMRYASAAYGWTFMRCFGLGEAFHFRTTKNAHASEWSFANHVGIPIEDVLLSSFTDDSAYGFYTPKMTPVVNYIAVDRKNKAIVLACRGTMGLSDVLVDLTADYETVEFEFGATHVHSGIWAAAKGLARSSGTVMNVLRKALVDYPEYGLVTVGHSLGAGVAVLAAAAWSCRAEAFEDTLLAENLYLSHPKIATPFVTSLESGLPPGRPIHAYGFGTPAIVEADFSPVMRGLVTTLVHNFDMIPTLCLGTVRDFLSIAEVLEVEVTESTTAILKKTIGLYQHKRQERKAQQRESLPALHRGADHSIQSGTDPTETDELLPSNVPAVARLQHFDAAELATGRTHNQAGDLGYKDPRGEPDIDEPLPGHSERRLSKSGQRPPSISPFTPHRPLPSSSSYTSQHRHQNGQQQDTRQTPAPDPEDNETADLEDWLWSLLKTLRAHAQSEKLYPPGKVYCIEAFEVYVKANEESSVQDKISRSGSRKKKEDYRSRGNGSDPSTSTSAATSASATTKTGNKTTTAQRVILRACEDVVSRFSEPVFCRSLFRDHLPSNYEFCLDLLREATRRGDGEDRQDEEEEEHEGEERVG